jgi:molybdopterin synthase catalytic subunit
MNIAIEIIDGPLPPLPPRQPGTKSPAGSAGALLIFEGIVRAIEGEGTIEALHYQVYEPMAQTMLGRIAQEIGEQRGLLHVHVQHSRGCVGVGGVSFRLMIESPHRKEGLAATDEFIDLMKKDVPIWKRPVWRTSPEQAL